MIPEITQENVHIFIPYKVSKICSQLCQTQNISVEQAIMMYYQSKTAKLLSDESTKLWHDGWVGIYDLFKAEKNDN